MVRRLFYGNGAEDDLRGKIIVEPYVVHNMPPGDIDSGVFEDTHFPAKGTPHPRQSEAVLTSRKLVQRVNQTTAIFALTYRSNLPFGAAFRGASSAHGFTRAIRVPRWRAYLYDVSILGIPFIRTALEYETVERAYASLSYTVELAGVSPDSVVADSSPYFNHAFAINNIWWIYQGVSARESAGNRTLATHRFQTSGGLPGAAAVLLPSGSFLYELPALDPLDEYTTIEGAGSQAPATLVRPRGEIYVEEPDIRVLPGLPL